MDDSDLDKNKDEELQMININPAAGIDPAAFWLLVENVENNDIYENPPPPTGSILMEGDEALDFFKEEIKDLLEHAHLCQTDPDNFVPYQYDPEEADREFERRLAETQKRSRNHSLVDISREPLYHSHQGHIFPTPSSSSSSAPPSRLLQSTNPILLPTRRDPRAHVPYYQRRFR